ncbi:MAG: YraN family protein [Prolixibacteraceae bacterium]
MNVETATDQEKDDMGRKGESIAVDYLSEIGYFILDTNWRHGHKEIDIIARSRDEIVVIEVKTRAENYAEEPWEAVTPSKIRNIVEVADVWLRINKVDLETRFDVISILINKDGTHALEHFKGAFIPPVN